MVILSEIIINVFLYVVVSQIPRSIRSHHPQQNQNCSPSEDLQDEYYTVTPATTDQFVPQDETDAKTIIDSNKNATVIASILPYREKVRRYAINIKMATNSTNKKTPWFPISYTVQHNPFDDLCFGLIEKEATVIGNYLGHFIIKRDYHWIGIALVLTKDIQDMITIFDSHYTKNFETCRSELKDSYNTMIQNWAKQNREPLEKEEPNHDSVMKDANALNAEHNNGGWKGNCTELESILFKKSIKYARAVITEFEKLNNGNTLEDILSKYWMNENLANTYGYFVRYIKNKPKFIADILLQYSDGSDSWAIWIMCIAVVHPQEWPKIDEVFKKCPGGSSLSAYITSKNNDKVMAEMMAVTIDVSFKPTKFKPAPGQSLYPSSVTPTTPAHS